jgi:hypothetical protein
MDKKKFKQATSSVFQEAFKPNESGLAVTTSKTDRETYAKLKAIAFWNRRILKEEIAEALRNFVQQHEKEKGLIYPSKISHGEKK